MDTPPRPHPTRAIQFIHQLIKKRQFTRAKKHLAALSKHNQHQPEITYALALLHIEQGDMTSACQQLEALKSEPVMTSQYHYLRARIAFHQQHYLGAREQIALALRSNNDVAEFWQLSHNIELICGTPESVSHAFQNYLRCSAPNNLIANAAKAFFAGNVQKAESLCIESLKHNPKDVSAGRLMADIAIHRGNLELAQRLLERCVQVAPDYHYARLNLASVLNKRERCAEAMAQVHFLEQMIPGQAGHAIIKASILVRLGKYEEACALYHALTERMPQKFDLWNSWGHVLKILGRTNEAIHCYQNATRLNPTDGEAFWNLANLKTYTFTKAEIAHMEQLCQEPSLSQDSQTKLHFSLGKAYEDCQQYEASFLHYAQGNTIREQTERYDKDCFEKQITDTIQQHSAKFTTHVKDKGHPSREPIFIVGLPRSGSTLVEQIIAAHSQVEGTKELPHIIMLSKNWDTRWWSAEPHTTTHDTTHRDTTEQTTLSELGERYLSYTRPYRIGKDRFIDKMPNNFQHIGLIKSILPNAKIIDIRREPMSVGFSCFKQLFSRGQSFSYSLSAIGHYYRQYLRLMQHWHQVYPEQILTIHYENLVARFDETVLQLLNYCELTPEAACFSYFQSKRPVNTPSAEQVRQPIYTQGMDRWQHYAPFLRDLSTALSSRRECHAIATMPNQSNAQNHDSGDKNQLPEHQHQVIVEQYSPIDEYSYIV